MSRLQEDFNEYSLENSTNITQCNVYEYADHTNNELRLQLGGLNNQTLTNVASNSVQENNYGSVENELETVNLQVEQSEVRHDNNEREILHGVENGKDQASDDINQKAKPKLGSKARRRIYWAAKKPKLADIVKSRQSDYPFILDILKFDKHFKCFGCNNEIKPMNMFLNHREEYPTKSGNIVAQSYHVDINCLLKRGFQSEYISKIKVMLRKKYNTTHDDLIKMGFQVIEDYNKESYDKRGSDVALPVTSELPMFSTGASPEGPNIFAMRNSRLYYQLRLLHADHDEPMSCYSCLNVIIPGSHYLSTKESDIITTFHVNKKCLLAKGQVTLNELRNACCYIMKDYNSENVQNLLKCGFISQNIRRYINRNNKSGKPKFVRNKMPNIKGKNGFMFNLRPFEMVFYLSNNVTCSGCKKSIKVTNKPHFLQCLLHKEVIPSDKKMEKCLPGNKAEQLPTSQYYHVNWNCLHDRGFTNAYLKISLCKMEKFHPIPNRFQTNIKILLQCCGFLNVHIVFHSDTNTAIQLGLEGVSSYKYPPADRTLTQRASKFGNQFIRIIKFHSSKKLPVTNKCYFCKFGLFESSICLIYTVNQGNRNEHKNIYHLNCFKSTCRRLVNAHNIPYQLDSDVPDGVLVHCGIQNNSWVYRRNNLSPNFPQFLNTLTVKKRQKVLVLIPNEKKICRGCHIGICRDTYAMFFTKDLKWIHLDMICLKLAHYQPNDIDYRTLSMEARTILRDCGFSL